MKFKELKNKLKERFLVSVSCGVLAFSLVITGITCSVYAEKNDTDDTDSASEDADIDTDGLVDDLFDGELEQKDIDKEETVYIIADANGAATSTIVSDHLYNRDGAATIEDKSNLSDIENVKGDEDYTESNGSLVWNANGNDIYYQGTTSQELPVTTNVTYYLDGNQIQPSELAGKSGKVTIRYDYTNNTSYTETIKGKEITVKVPFAAISALVLNDDFSNVEVTNGKLVETSAGNVVVGFALPGLADSLKLSEKNISNINLPDYFEVSADVENFNLDIAMTIVANAGSYVSSGEVSLDSLDDLVDTLSDACDQLDSGSTALKDGMKTLYTGLKAYTDGVAQLNSGINTLSSKTGSLTSGVSTLNASAAKISEGIATLDKTLNTSMTTAEKTAAEKLAAAAVAKSYQNGTEEEIAASIYKALRYNTDGTDGTLYTQLASGGAGATKYANTNSTYEAKVLAVLQGAATKLGVAFSSDDSSATLATKIATGLETSANAFDSAITTYGFATAKAASAEGYQAYITYNAIKDLNDASMAEYFWAGDTTNNTSHVSLYEAVYAGIEAAAAASGDTTKSTVEAALHKLANSLAASTLEISQSVAKETAVTTAESTKKTIAAGIEAVDKSTGYSLVTGAAALAKGTGSLVDAMPTLTSGIKKLKTGSNTIAAKNSELMAGAKKLVDGSATLSDGITKLNEEGVQKILEAYNGDVKELANRVQAVLDASENYGIFTQAADGKNASVKFITKVAPITADTDEDNK